MDENDRQAMIIAQFRNKDSAMYKNMVAILRDCEQADKRARAKSAYVGFPFSMDATDTAALEAQFNVRIKLTAGQKRSPLTDRVAGMIVLLDAALLEHAGGVGRDVMIIDGDIMTSVACGIDGIVIERSNATPRLAYGYHMEDEMVHRAVTCKTDKLAVKAEILHREIVAGGGEHYSPVVQLEGGNVAAIVVNHFKTPVGPHQLAYLAIHRAASVFGCLPFQPDMLIKDVGDLVCFPGKYYIDHGLDTLTMVPSQDATMSISMPYSSWRAIITNNVITVDNVEFLCEKYNSVPGVLYYTLQSVTDDFEFPEKLTTNYFDCKKLGITEISMPKVKFSDSGVPVGWDRKVVRVFTERVEKVLARLMTSANQIVMPSEAFSVLCDYNNTVINSLDTTQIAKRMDVDDEMEVANALALHTNWMRHASKGTFKVLLDAVKLKYDVAEVNVLRLAAVALHAWWSSPNFERDVKYEEVPVSKVLDWCGNDFSVLMKEADPWIEISQMSGVKLASEAKYYDWMPKPAVTKESSWFKNIMDRVYASATSSIAPVAAKQKPKSAIIPAVTRKLMKPVASGAFVGAEVSEGEVLVSRSQPNFTPVKSLLLDKLIVEQGAFKSNSVVRGLTVLEGPSNTLMPTIPIEDVEPYSAIMDDLLMVNKGPIESLGVKTAYRLAEADISKNVSGSFMINDFKRNLPKSKFVRMPKIDAGVEGSRAASQISLFGALAKRNLGVPNNRGSVNLDAIAPLAVDRMIATCYREDWESIVEKHLDAGMFEFNVPDIENFIDGIDEKKVKAILNEFFMEGHVQLDKWQLFAKPGVKPGREPQSHSKVDHAQTILFLRESSVNAAYSAMIKHLKECIDECLRPNVHIIPQCSDAEQEEWYNSLQPLRDGCRRTYSYGNDIRTFDRSLEKPASRLHMEFYARHGLNSDRLKIWESQYGLKKASSMMFGIVVYLGTIGISGIFDTIMRNSICTWGATVVGGKLERQDIIMLDIKGDDMDLETSRPVNVEETIEIMSLSFNFSAKMYTNDVRYYCKQFRVRKWGRWYQIADPWAKIQSLCKPLVVGHMEDLLDERYVSLQSDLRHYDNGLLVDVAAECAQVYYGTERPLYGFAKALAVIASDRSKYFAMFHPAERVD